MRHIRILRRRTAALAVLGVLAMGCDTTDSAADSDGFQSNDDSPLGARAAENPFAGEKLWVDTSSHAYRTVNEWRSRRPADAALLEQVASQAAVPWFVENEADIAEQAAHLIARIKRTGALPVITAYNIPKRDCGSYAAGGAPSEEAYLRWVRNLAAGIGNDKAVILLEPDAMNEIDCLSVTERRARFALLARAITILRGHANTYVYLDAGNPSWEEARVVAERLREAGIESANGFVLNISNFQTTAENVRYGREIAALTGGKRFIIDTSRNGAGPAPGDEWCNPAGRALGANPTTETGMPDVDAFLWIKTPGESDGECRGGPAAGVWWPEYALELVKARARLEAALGAAFR